MAKARCRRARPASKPKGPRSEGSGGLKVEMGSVLEGRSTELFIVRALRLCIVRALWLCAMTYTPIRAAQLVDATRACGVCSPTATRQLGRTTARTSTRFQKELSSALRWQVGSKDPRFAPRHETRLRLTHSWRMRLRLPLRRCP